MSGIIKIHQCVFCDKKFTRRSWYDKHDCPKKRRFAEANNLDTIRAQHLFQFWQRRMNIKRKASASPMTEFLESPFYGTFKKLVEFVQKSGVVSPMRYLEWLITNEIRERNWTNAKNLNLFRDIIRKQETVEEQVEISYRNIRAWCLANDNIPVDAFFDKIDPASALIMVRQNRLMPWVLLGYDRSVIALLARFSHEHMIALDEFINLEHWLSKIDEHPDQRALVQKMAKEHAGEAA